MTTRMSKEMALSLTRAGKVIDSLGLTPDQTLAILNIIIDLTSNVIDNTRDVIVDLLHAAKGRTDV